MTVYRVTPLAGPAGCNPDRCFVPPSPGPKAVSSRDGDDAAKLVEALMKARKDESGSAEIKIDVEAREPK